MTSEATSGTKTTREGPKSVPHARWREGTLRDARSPEPTRPGGTLEATRPAGTLEATRAAGTDGPAFPVASHEPIFLLKGKPAVQMKTRAPPPPPVDPGTPPKREYTVIVAVRQGANGKEFLMVRHKERGWELPGGKLEANEGPVHCALREFREETSHLLAQPHFVAKLHKDNGTCYVFTGALGVEVENDAEDVIDAMEWFTTLPRDQKLAFPDDPYEEMGQLLGIAFG